LILSSFLIVDRQYFSTRQPIFLSSFINTFPQQSAFNLSPPTKSPHKQHQLTTFLSCLFQYQHHPLSLTHNGPRRIQRNQQRDDDGPSGKPRSRRVQPANPAGSGRVQLSSTQLARSQENRRAVLNLSHHFCIRDVLSMSNPSSFSNAESVQQSIFISIKYLSASGIAWSFGIFGIDKTLILKWAGPKGVWDGCAGSTVP
jgi:hypothetical protein